MRCEPPTLKTWQATLKTWQVAALRRCENQLEVGSSSKSEVGGGKWEIRLCKGV